MNCIFNSAHTCPTPDKMCPGCPDYERALDLAGDERFALAVEYRRKTGLGISQESIDELNRQRLSGAVDWRG